MYEINQDNVVDYSCFPKIIVRLKKPDDVKILINEWVNLYNNGNTFSFIFDLTCTKASIGNLTQGVVLANFIKKIKKLRKTEHDKYNLLRESYIIAQTKASNFLIRAVFDLTTPLSDTYIIKSIDNVDIIYNNINNNIDFDCSKYKDVKLIKGQNN
jgi:hypothetical protein